MINNAVSHSDNDAGFTVHRKDLKWLPLAPKVSNVVKLAPEAGEYTIMIYILKGSGAYPQTGAFVEGDYVLESKGAVHDLCCSSRRLSS
ncbi:uncharacterized protein BDV17DRAFT_293980 [Aspergillus undulatus]|uniref:uncharacterized protein n=1 Tax=Aspergillus undulatus TaxID=1810928 RepID=UPI003CCE4D68